MTAAVTAPPNVSTAVPLPAAPAPVRDAAPPSWSTILLLFPVRFGLPLLTVVLALWDLLLLFAMMLLMPKNDFGRTFLSVVAFVRGEDMYGMNESVPWWLEYNQIYLWNLNPPHFHLLLLPLAWLSNDVALGVWLVFSAACLLLAFKVMLAEVRIEWTPLKRQLALVGLLAFIGTGTALVTGHISFILFLLLTLAWRDARHGRWTRSAVALALALSVKPFLLMLVPYYLWRRQWKATAALAGTVALCYLAGLVVFGVDNNRSWLERMRLAESWAWLPMNASIMGLLTRSFTPNFWYAAMGPLSPETVKVIWLALGVPLGLLSLAAVAPDRSPRGVDRAFGLLLVASLLLSPLGWTYYFPLALGPILMLAVTWGRDRAAADRPGWTGRQKLLVASIPGFCMPLFGLDIGQPYPIFSATFASIYCWSVLFVWLALVIDGFRCYRRAAPAPSPTRTPPTKD
jgi:hypothetical protein